MLSLIFFVLMLAACKQEGSRHVAIEWNGEQAKGIIIPLHLLHYDEHAAQLLTVRLEKTATDMLGSYSMQQGYILFQPLVPLTRGLSYEILFRNKLVERIKVPEADAAAAPLLVAMYPSVDTVPENLLKIYLQFSTPMQEGVALQNLKILNEEGDTLPHIFLNLQQELWNRERTVLTLWLDPGRIKRDLIPNREMGNPLQSGYAYTLLISDKWKGVQGLPLQRAFTKKFFVKGRDDASPQPSLWKMNLLKAGSKKDLSVEPDEPLDYFLLQETITIIDDKTNKVEGEIEVREDGKSFEFVPVNAWRKGRYRLRIASHLEDLAGNNLIRPFDRDITKQQEQKEVDFIEKEFLVSD